MNRHIKRIISLMLSIVLSLGCVSFFSFADDLPSRGFTSCEQTLSESKGLENLSNGVCDLPSRGFTSCEQTLSESKGLENLSNGVCDLPKEGFATSDFTADESESRDSSSSEHFDATALPVTDISGSDDFTTTDDISVAVVSGIHFVDEMFRGGADTSFNLETKISGVQVTQLDGLLTSGFDCIKSLKESGVNTLIVTGGMTYNGYSVDHQSIAKKLEQFENDSGIDVLVVPGVGDIYNRKASFYSEGKKLSGWTLSTRDFRTTYKNLSFDKTTGLEQDRYSRLASDKSGANSYTVTLGNKYRLIFIDAAYHDDSEIAANNGRNVVGKIDDNLMTWIVNQTKNAIALGQTPIGVCGWDLKASEGILPGNILENADEVAYTLADAGMHYILTGGSGRNDISSIVNINGQTIYDVQSADLTSFPNTIRKCTFTKGQVKTELFDIDTVTRVAYINDKDQVVAYDKPYRESASLKIQYENYDLAKYALNFVENFVYNGLIPGVEEYGTLEDYMKAAYGIDLEAKINEYLGGGITILGFLTFFDAKNVMNLLTNSVFPQLFGKHTDKDGVETPGVFLEDPVKFREIFYGGFKTITDAIVSQKPCDKYISSYGFGNYRGGGTLNDLLLSLIVQNKMGNEDISDNEFLQDVGKYLKNGQLVTFLANVLADGLVKQIFIDGFLDNIGVDLEQLIFLDKENDDFGSYINYAVKLYMKLHGNKATYKGLLVSLLKDGMFKDYGKTVDSAVQTYLDTYFKGDRAVSVGVQLGILYDYYTADSDPAPKSDYNCTIKYPGKVAAPAKLIQEMKPSIVTISYNYDPTSSATISWYTNTMSTGTDIELYTKNSGFKGKNNIGVKDVFVEANSTETTREYSKIDFGFTDVGKSTVNVIRHTVSLYNLTPNKTYYFRIGDEQTKKWSNTLKLKTAPDSGKFSFVQITDTSGILQSHFDMDKNIANCIANVCKDSSFTLHTGNFVSNGNDYKQWQNMTGAMTNLLGNYVTVPVKGVSEYGTSSIADNFAPFGFIDEKGKELGYYSFNISDTHITVIDSTNLRFIGGLSDAETKWIKNDIKSSDRKWNIVAVHNSTYTNGYSTQSKRYKNFFENLTKTLSGLRVDLVLSGDSDVYYRTDSVRDNKVDQVPKVSYEYGGKKYRTLVKPAGTVYSSIGASGKNAYAKHKTYDTNKFFSFTGVSRTDSLPMFSKITVDGDALILESYTVSGNIVKLIDSVMIRKSGKEYMMGDVDGNGIINAADARFALRLSARLETSTEFLKNVADVDGNGMVNATDARKILRVAARLDDFSSFKNGGITLLF